jgi:hypothetical protein
MKATASAKQTKIGLIRSYVINQRKSVVPNSSAGSAIDLLPRRRIDEVNPNLIDVM